ncbi:efflux transporter outer membrane subunit [Variovorax ureilyticus]|uniref:Efflux transporter outer membrane subunit n=1 Tax=Variovorax ureilyticus TaxID=1836198 RepID=A0ABU8VKY9_9BURK
MSHSTPTPARKRIRTTTAAALAAAAVAFAVGGCTVGPDYRRPEVQAPAAWRIDYPMAADVANTKWWEQFGDPVLNELVETALRDNLDVRVAAARIDQFIGTLGTVRSQFYPQLAYSGAASRTRASRVGQPPIPEPADPYFTLYQAALGASWQIDLFGRVRRLSEAAQSQVYASEQAQRGVVLTLVAGVATSYITLRGLDRQREIAVATAGNFGETARIFDLRFKSGIVSKTEVTQVRSQWQQALASIPVIEQQIAAVEGRISILLGRDPGPIPRGRTIDQLVAPLIPADLPSTLLERRPDILQAEQNLVAANASIGAARALYYPSISLTGLYGSTSTAAGSFLTGPATAWQAAASLTGPIFTFGAIEGQVRSAEAQKAQAELVYQSTILNAFRDTNDALIGTQKTIEGVAFQRERVIALREFARLSRLKFESGLIGYLEVLVADTELFAAELALVGLTTDRYTQVVNVYQAMGGGWVDVADAMTPRPVGSIK